MGYTHYFDLRPSKELADDAKRIIEASNVSIKGPDGEGEPILTPSLIALNGDNSLDESFESFVIERGSRGFCKTGYRPYDKVVCAILLRGIVLGVPDSDAIGSDGFFSDWKESGAFTLYAKAFGKLSKKDFEKVRQTLGWQEEDFDAEEFLK